jgi:hypothetical protein
MGGKMPSSLAISFKIRVIIAVESFLANCQERRADLQKIGKLSFDLTSNSPKRAVSAAERGITSGSELSSSMG